MTPLKVIGAIDDEGQLKKIVYVIGPVTQRDFNVMHRKNLANYVYYWVFHNIVRYLQDFMEAFTDLYHVGVGQFWSHTATEVDCKSLLSQLGFLSEPRRVWSVICMYKCIVVGKNCLNRIHWYIPTFKELFMKGSKDS